MSRPAKIISFSLATISGILVLYLALYLALSSRDQSRFRTIETYVFLSEFKSDWEARAFAPVGYVESRLIWVMPKIFLTNPSWADSNEPRMVLIKSDRVRFWFRASTTLPEKE